MKRGGVIEACLRGIGWVEGVANGGGGSAAGTPEVCGWGG